MECDVGGPVPSDLFLLLLLVLLLSPWPKLNLSKTSCNTLRALARGGVLLLVAVCCCRSQRSCCCFAWNVFKRTKLLQGCQMCYVKWLMCLHDLTCCCVCSCRTPKTHRCSCGRCCCRASQGLWIVLTILNSGKYSFFWFWTILKIK